ncbi:Gfo/Idh/MocA family protein [Arthrospiribacter ruber]|uniref:Gfo/Idh/MocA family oxidoreductase n=1 Tax=Arthrospiribacter ruber TaxID=2487934 RepID=A0A951IZW0_9BACT|nr:Gfo/Idh/MocA family oxidoreductase [Arthrospiribacter ruber]MBW3470180.1 gfo/Idh/MocA family oxidoreductase [Arthrospiribacter ruber]
MNPKFNRREFVKTSAFAVLGLQFIPFTGLRGAPSDRVRIAHIGLGGMGLSHMNWFANLPDVEIVALCDVDMNRAEEALQKLKEIHPDSKAQIYQDFRFVLDRADVDAVTIATPDHWHAQIAVLAFQSGKDVYGEKPLSYSFKEGDLMLKSLADNKRVFQLGTQIHSGDNYHRVAEILQSGVLGKIKTVRLWKTGEPTYIEKLNFQTPPKHLNWDMWLGPAPYSEYAPEKCHFTYRYFLEYSGGVFQDFWCHIADVVWWGIQPQKLKKVSAKGEKSEGVGDTPKWIDVDFKFKNLDLYWTSTPPDVPGASERHIGAYFEGSKGTLICDYSSREIRIDGEVLSDVSDIPLTIPRSPGHQQNFIDAVKSRQQPQSHLAYAKEMTLPMYLAMVSYRLKRPLKWNSNKEIFRGDTDANDLLFRPYRKEWNLIGI